MNDQIVGSLVASYRSMMQMEAWKDLESYAKAEGNASMVRMDSKSASELSLGEVCEERGVRKGLLKLIRHAENRRDGI